MLAGPRGCSWSCLLCSSTRLRRAFSTSKAFVWCTGSPHPFHRRGCGVGLRRESPKRVQQQQQQQQQRCCKKVIHNTYRCHRMTVPAAGGRRTGSATPNRCEQQQQQQQQHSSSSQASIGAVVGCDRFLRASKTCSIEQSDPRHPVENSTFSTGCADRIARSKKLGSKRHFFDCVRTPDSISDRKSPFSIHRSNCIRIGRKNARFGL